jgi:hypothetical protein
MENKSPQPVLASAPNILSSGKDLVALIRDVTIFSLLVLLVMFPKTFNQRLVQAGFDKGTLMGMEWKSNLESSNATLTEAQKSISDLQEQNAALLKKLVAVGQKATDVGTKDQIAKLEEDTSRLKAATESTKDKVSQTIASNAALVSSSGAQTSAQQPVSDYLVGLQTLGCTDDERIALNERIRSAGYGLHNLSAAYAAAARPSWFAPHSTVLYYGDAALPAAQALATFLKGVTGDPFRTQRGAGLGVNPSEKNITLFVHYIKPLAQPKDVAQAAAPN